MTSSYLLHIVAFVWPWQHITHSISPIITTIFGRGCIAANFPVGAASLRSNGETFNGVAAAGEYFPDLEQRAAPVKVWTKHNPILADEPFHISWSFSQHTNKCLAGRFYIAIDIAICTQW